MALFMLSEVLFQSVGSFTARMWTPVGACVNSKTSASSICYEDFRGAVMLEGISASKISHFYVSLQASKISDKNTITVSNI